VIQDPSQLNKRAEDFIEEYREAQEQLAVPSSSNSAQQQGLWMPPTGLAYKINFDAAVFVGSNGSGVGVIIRNNMGEVKAALSVRVPSVRDSEEAEALACKRALEFAREAGFQDLILEGDNVTVMQSLRCPQATCSSVGHIYGDIRYLGRILLICVLRAHINFYF